MEPNPNQDHTNTSKALLLYQQAHKKLHPGCCESIFSSSEERIDQAFDYLKEAAQLYTLDKEYADAAKCYIECAEIKQINKEPYIEYYDEALKLYFKLKDSKKYNEILSKCVDAAIENGKYNQAADYVYDSAQILEEENNYKEAIDAYEKAVSYYEMDKDTKKRTMNMINVKRADLMCITSDSKAKEEARAIYEDIGVAYLNSNDTAQMGQDLLAKCVLCYMVYDDYISARAFLHKFYGKDYSFKGSPIGVFIEELIEALEESSKEKFDKAVTDYKTSNKKAWNSSGWMTVMISQIEAKLNSNGVHQENEDNDSDYK